MSNIVKRATAQLSLLGFDTGNADTKIKDVFGAFETPGEEGTLQVAQEFSMNKKKDVGAATGRDKEALAQYILEARDAMKPKILALLTQMMTDPNWTFTKMRVARTKKGKKSFSLRMDEIIRAILDDEKVAKAWGIPVEQVTAMRIKQQKELRDKEAEAETLSVDSEPPSVPVTEPEPAMA